MGDTVNICEFSKLLSLRAEERFNQRNLAPRLQATLQELIKLANSIHQHNPIAFKSSWVINLCKILIILSALAFLYPFQSYLFQALDPQNSGQFIQVIESASNLVLIVGAAIFSVLSLDKRLRRTQFRRRIAKVRSIVNTLALLQLEKDPGRLYREIEQNTEHSPRLSLTPLELDCYFEYSLEALEICSAILSSYSRDLDDAVLIDEISDLQDMATAKQNSIAARKERLQDLMLANKSPRQTA